jgi:hypothetical protein
MRESKPTIEESLATIQDIEGRTQLVRWIFDALGEKGVTVTDEMIHVSHYGFDDRIDWDEYIIVVDRYGVFGFTDGPCPYVATHADLLLRKGNGKHTETTAQNLCSDEAESAYGLNDKSRSLGQ